MGTSTAVSAVSPAASAFGSVARSTRTPRSPSKVANARPPSGSADCGSSRPWAPRDCASPIAVATSRITTIASTATR